ncbi:phage tail tape measure protein [Spirosoma humi]
MQLKEEALFTLKFDGKPVRNELGELEQKLNEVKEAQKTVERGTQEWANNKEDIKQLELAIKNVREEMGVSGMTVNQLQGYYRQLNREIRDLTPGTEAYQKKAAELAEVNTVLAEHRQTIRGVNEEVEKQPSLWERAKATAAGYMASFGATELLERAFNFVQDGIQKALQLSDMMGSVAKATQLSTEQVQGLSEELDKIDTRTTKESLMEIAQIGGQLGVANEELLGFVQSTDMAAVALGDEFSGGAEEAASKLGGLKKLFNETDELKYGDAINRIGSAINELGADGSATGPVIAEFTARMGQLGDLSPQITQTMGLGAAFQELGLSAEISAGGLSNILLTAAKDTATFAQQLGYTDDEFKKIINTDPNRFILELANSLKGVPADQLATRLYDLGIKSQESIKVMSLLKDQTQLVTDKQELANKAFAEGTSLGDEFNTMNETAAAQYEKSQKSLALIATEIGQGLLPAITLGTRGIVTFVNIIRAIPEFVSENRTSFAALGVAILAMNANLVVATYNSIASAAAEKARLVWTNSATAAQWLLNAAMTANPIALIVTAVALLVAGFTALYNNSETVRGVLNGLWEGIKVGVGIAGDITSAIVDWIQKGLEPMRPALETAGRLAGALWDIFDEGIAFVVSIHQAIVAFASNGLALIGTALTPVRSALSSFWSVIDTGITKIKEIGSTISSFLHLDTLVSKTKQAAGQIGDAFNKGYGDKLAEGQPKVLASHQKLLNDKKTAETKNAGELVTLVTASDQKALDKKADQASKHRAAEQKKEADHQKKLADDAVKANNEALKQIETLRIASIKDDLTRTIATIRAKRDSEVEAMMASKASAEVKAVWEKALNEQMLRDITKAETDARTKKATEEEKARVDREARERTTSNAVATASYDAAHQALEKQLADETLKNSQRKTMAMQLIELERTETLRKINDQYTAEVNKLNKEKADAIRTAQEKGQTIDGLENQFRQQYMAAEQNRRTHETAAENTFQTDKKNIEKTALDARKANQQAWFDAIKGLMSGDFTTFTNSLAQKLAGEKKHLTDSQKANIDKIDKVGSYAVAGLQALSNLSQAALNKELSNIDKEKKTQLAAWKDKYDKGLINKDQYEKGIDSINKTADAKMKAAQLEAFKRQQKIDIALAIINGLQAALKSLAMLGWPFGLIAAAGAAVSAGIQIAAIKSQQPPSLASGGKIRNAGVPDGPRHGSSYGDSGLSITRRDTGEEVAEMEGGEPIMVLSRNTYRNNRGIVDSLLHSSLHRNGAPVMRQGGLMFEDGGGYNYQDHENSVYRGDSSGGFSSGPSDETPPAVDSPGSSWMDDANTAATEMDNSDYQAEIDKSQAMMEAIGKNTLATVDGIKLLNDTLLLLKQQADLNARDLDTSLSNSLFRLVNSLVTNLDVLREDSAADSLALRQVIHADLVDLKGTMKIELPSLGKDLTDEFVNLRQALALGLMTLRFGINTDVTALQTTTKTGFDELQKLTHDDLKALQTTTKTEVNALQKGMHTDSLSTQVLMHTDLTNLQLSVHDDLENLIFQQEKQAYQLALETKLNFAQLQTILKSELLALQQATHTDLTNLQTISQTELRTVQNILTMSKNEQGMHTTLLRIISEKNLSVSLQNVINVWNQIDVIVDKSNFK